MANTINPIQAGHVQPTNHSSVSKKDSDGDNDNSGSSIGPAVILSLSNTTKNDAAQGDPDGDGH